MFLTEIASDSGNCVAASSCLEGLVARIRSLARAPALRALPQGGEPERYLSGSADRFELERREREWIRCSEGSLLGP
jgi:hypothetical protein